MVVLAIEKQGQAPHGGYIHGFEDHSLIGSPVPEGGGDYSFFIEVFQIHGRAQGDGYSCAHYPRGADIMVCHIRKVHRASQPLAHTVFCAVHLMGHSLHISGAG